jgi:predicted ATP-dependent endonuclease of OLD family
MKLRSIQINNYRSVEEVSLEIDQLADTSYTYGLIGVNESGKSSILKALALKDGLSDKEGPLPRQKDFKDTKKPIEITYFYSPNESEIEEFIVSIRDQFSEIALIPAHFEELILKVSFSHDDPTQRVITLEVPKIIYDEKENIQEQIKQLVQDKSHKSLFWTAEDRYLITQPINLGEFANDQNISIPLWNCFSLANIRTPEEIREKIALLTQSTERELLREELGEKVTAHINSAWPGHQIKITFDISDGLITLHVHDKKAKGKAKTVDQRSDGFGQFISFILSVSAENKNEELVNKILLIDEPETHLHPQAQEDMLKELVKISQNDRNNVTFFATHSNHLVDKDDLSRNYRVSKPEDTTDVERFNVGTSSYASVTYKVFGVSSGDYHNELYDLLREKYAKSKSLELEKVGITEFDNGFFRQEKKLKPDFMYKDKKNGATLPTYVRNAIHYPDNRDTDFDKRLRESIELLVTYED